MPALFRKALVVAATSFVVCLQGCRSSCDDETVDRAVAFMEAHQGCETDEDCVVVSDFCEEIPGGWCGQLTMSREGERSAEWKEIEAELSDCGPSECTVCGGALVPTCGKGSCGGP